MKGSTNLFLEIFNDYWDIFKQKKTAYSTPFYDSIVEKMMSCGDPKEGYIQYRCTKCWEDEITVAFTCKHAFCLRCGRIKAMQFVEKVKVLMYEDITYKHLTLTSPEYFWTLFYQNRHTKDLFNKLYKAAWDFIVDLFQKTTNLKKIIPGAIMVIHVGGRSGSYNTHLHIILPMGVIDGISGKWVDINWVDYDDLHHLWKKHLFNMFEEHFKNCPKEMAKILEIKDGLPDGLVAHLDPEKLPKGGGGLAGYLAKYLFSPTISLKRILKYDKVRGRVIYEYSDHKTQKVKRENVSVIDFIGRMVQQIMPEGFQRVRYYGIHGTCCQLESKEKVVKGVRKKNNKDDSDYIEIELKKVKTLTFRERIMKIRKRDPLRCKNCGDIMELSVVWLKERGYIFNLLDKMATGPPDRKSKAKTEKNTPIFNDDPSVQLRFCF